MVGSYVTTKPVRTKHGELMAFGTFLDVEGKFFDTTHFPPSLKQYPFTGSGVYLILGKVVEEFGFPSLEVAKMVRLPIKGDSRA
jgi:DNA polymerase-3 subunit alpha